ncbi:hypothetical protein H5154_21900 [Pseudoalteromonas sp. SR44-5]|uniref:Uncharacterized protein n=1 Tax=Pseudoalteromonas rhizosphaerae TaxID=2518973 RepID=A0ABW8KW37_9GAMM|nr:MULTISPECIES: hypothetical protein [unclassified Pseudoalteromonas]MBB1333376.1 hypothetical protein [Pseudoalteromonas sp. SR41-6]MBB1368997.1 hypothetical protein [Pseudoalteromonas sp. SR44-5]MBB1417230.1 hypothetical protein [Pseudoalteromonas sp. SG44-1]MBB1458575.1 hypothetical protein [Pseudoalteromonas sp. SG41-8]
MYKIELQNFHIKENKGWDAIESLAELTKLGYPSNRLGKYVRGSNEIQVTIGSTKVGQSLGLNEKIEKLILSEFPFTDLSSTKTTNGSIDKPEYPTFLLEHKPHKLNAFMIKLEKLLIDAI